jgi:hypothetical protein
MRISLRNNNTYIKEIDQLIVSERKAASGSAIPVAKTAKIIRGR